MEKEKKEKVEVSVDTMNAVCKSFGAKQFLIGGKTFHISHEMASKRSDFFKAMFSGNFAESKEQEMELVLPEPDHFGAIYLFLHTGMGLVAVCVGYFECIECVPNLIFCLGFLEEIQNFGVVNAPKRTF